MRTSKTRSAAPAKHSVARKVVSAIVIVAIIALGISAGTFVMTPYGSKSQVVWSEFRQTESIDTLCLGSSLIANGYDPAVIDSTFGTASFNMSTPLQETAESYLGLKEAIEHHEIKHVVFGVDYSAFVGEPSLYPARVFENEKWKGDGIGEQISDLSYMLDGTDWLFDERSINWLFPWTEQQPASGLLRNVRMRLDGTTLVEAAEANEEHWHYYGRGYGNSDTVVDYNDGDQEDFARVAQFNIKPFSEKKLQGLADMIELCNEHGIEFVAVAPALPDFSLISLKPYYDKVSEPIRETVEAHGGAFYDFNVADPTFYQPLDSHFQDYQHYNAEGGKAFSEALAKLLAARSAGEDVSSWFTSYDERLASIDHISTVRFQSHQIRGGARIRIICLAGTNVEPEFQILAKRAGKDRFEVVRDWSPETSFDFTPGEKGRYTILVNAREQGSDLEFERWSKDIVRI